MFNFNHLYYFYITAKMGGVTRASEYLHVSQPSLSIQLKTLEESLKVNLFLRTGRNLELTDKGKVIFEYCERMFIEAQGLSYFLSEKNEIHESLNIGVSEQIERPFLADIVGSYLKKFASNNLPKIRMQTFEESIMLSKLALGNLDLIISPKYIQGRDLEYEKFTVPVALIGKDKSLRKIKSLRTFFKNDHINLILPLESFILRTETDYFLSKNDCQYNIVFESSNMAANIRAISEGIGFGFLPVIYVAKDLKTSSLFSYMPAGGIWKHQFYVYYSARNTQKESTQKFIETMSEIVTTF